MSIKTCNSDKHPYYTAVYDGDKHDECPACAMAGVLGNMALVKLALEYMGEAYGTLQKLVDPIASNPATPIEPEETSAAGANRETIIPMGPSNVGPIEPATPPKAGPSTSDIKEECAGLERELGAANTAHVRQQNARFPRDGAEVTAWRGRRESAIAYRDALQAAVDKAYSAKMAADNRAPESKVTVHPSQPAGTPLTDEERAALVEATAPQTPEQPTAPDTIDVPF